MAARDAPEHPSALFATHWHLLDGSVHTLPLPPGLVGDGVASVVLASDHFATGSVYGGVAWALWMERLLGGHADDAGPTRPPEGPLARACEWVAARLSASWGDGRPLEATQAWAPYRYHTAVTARAIDAVFDAWQPSGARIVVSGCGAAGAFLAVDGLKSDAMWVRVLTRGARRPTRVPSPGARGSAWTLSRALRWSGGWVRRRAPTCWPPGQPHSGWAWAPATWSLWWRRMRPMRAPRRVLSRRRMRWSARALRSQVGSVGCGSSGEWATRPRHPRSERMPGRRRAR